MNSGLNLEVGAVIHSRREWALLSSSEEVVGNREGAVGQRRLRVLVLPSKP
jgi:hypothetical protein